ncbi:MAG TPA: prepilin-type N-terminal cleavage/methylation domain-containing protein [Candidatus Binatia bacterium]|nr:prepilin-type N-terminal cleavage/methylation domain-containing protein [Candidatus Binatia bacterium]
MRMVRVQTRRYPRLLCDVRGYSMVEMMVALSVAAIIMAIAIPRLRTQRVNIQTAYRQVIAAFRIARANAISKSTHYQVSFPDSTHVKISPMYEPTPGSGVWVVDTTKVQTQVLPNRTTINAAAVNTLVEFNSRGIVTNSTIPTPAAGQAPQVDVQDTYGATKSTQVWPSGQIYGLQ